MYKKDKEIRIPTKDDINEAYNSSKRINDFESFKQGIEFMIKFQDPEEFLKKTNHLGFEIDLKELTEIIMNKEDVDELYSIQSDMSFTDVTYGRDRITLNININGRSGIFNHDLVIDSLGRATFELDDSPWEDGGIETEMEEIVMEYIAKKKYLQ